MKSQSGFTLIELVVVIVVLGILAAVAVPKFVDLSDEATNASKAGMKGAVKSAFALFVAKEAAAGSTDDDIFPTVTELTGMVDGEGITAEATGVQVTINSATYIVKTYTDKDCSTATSAVGDTVKCVGSY
jgi:MSHA pilin protein MshA